MIITHLVGGLGNQMFQFAAGAAVARRRGDSLMVDIASFNRFSRHNGFELARVFDLRIEVAGDDDIGSVLGWRGRRSFRRAFRGRLFDRFHPASYVTEPHFHYWNGLDTAPSKVYMRGFWQSERYFSDCADSVRSWFRFAEPPEGENREWAARIGATESVAVHVRRGDYVTDPTTSAFHGALPLLYYRDAIRLLDSRIERPTYFVFSDDIEWAKANLNDGARMHFVSGNEGVHSYRDLGLMSLCRHHVIANSSFSWWGAWLSRSPEKIVVAPRRWFASGTLNTADLLPVAWVAV